jgi:hypothetical protein
LFFDQKQTQNEHIVFFERHAELPEAHKAIKPQIPSDWQHWEHQQHHQQSIGGRKSAFTAAVVEVFVT